MVDPTTTNRGYAVPARGTDVGTWDVPVNGNFGLLDNNLGGVSTVSLTNVDVILNSTQYQCGTIVFSGLLTGTVVITFPAVQGWWTVVNNCTGNFPVILRTASNVGRIGVAPGGATDVYADGPNMNFRNLPAVGSYITFATASVPSWITSCTVPPYLLCAGGTFSSSTYPILYAMLGSTTLPDRRGRAEFMLDQGAGRLTGSGGGIDGSALLNSGGHQFSQLDTTNVPSYTPSGTVTTTVSSPNTSGSADGGPLSASSGSPNAVPWRSGSGSPSSVITATSTFVGNSNGGNATAFDNCPPGLVAGIVMIRAA